MRFDVHHGEPIDQPKQYDERSASSEVALWIEYECRKHEANQQHSNNAPVVARYFIHRRSSCEERRRGAASMCRQPRVPTELGRSRFDSAIRYFAAQLAVGALAATRPHT